MYSVFRKFVVLVCVVLLSIASAQAGTVVKVTTPLGDFSVELYDDVTPITVTNFLHYVNAGLYNGTFIHRSEVNFVIQGGWLRFVEAENTLYPIALNPPIQNEYQISNTRGTLAMAKVGGDPNSATSQWFINLSDNNTFLNSSNGGFTVFGRVLGNGMEVVDAIAALPVIALTAGINTAPAINFSSSPLKNQNLVEITMAVSTPSPDWPAAYNGIAPDPVLGLPLNNIGYLNSADRLIYSCLAIHTNQSPATLGGIARFDIAFEIVSLESGIIRVVRTRPFNTGNVLNAKGEAPSCSGVFETTTNLFEDIVRVDTQTLRVVFELFDEAKLELRLKGVQSL